jgi:5'-nucleotidase
LVFLVHFSEQVHNLFILIFYILLNKGSRQTHFASQVSRFADIYASTVVNLVYYPFFYFFRAVPQLVCHLTNIRFAVTYFSLDAT